MPHTHVCLLNTQCHVVSVVQEASIERNVFLVGIVSSAFARELLHSLDIRACTSVFFQSALSICAPMFIVSHTRIYVYTMRTFTSNGKRKSRGTSCSGGGSVIEGCAEASAAPTAPRAREARGSGAGRHLEFMRKGGLQLLCCGKFHHTRLLLRHVREGSEWWQS